MTACKENRSTGKIVIVDSTKGQLQKLPALVQTAFRGKGNFWPKAVITDPAMSKVYGAYSYQDLKPQEYRSLFRDARRTFDKDADAGVLTAPGENDPGEPDAEETAADEPEAIEVVSFAPSDYETWHSAAGTAIEARLVAFDEQGCYVFERRDGKKITVKPKQLRDASRLRAESVVNGE